MTDYDAELQLHNERLRQAYPIVPTDRVLDVGCGSGQTTRDAARRAPDGEAVGIDVEPDAIERARLLAAAEAVRNATFIVGDAQTHDFTAAEFDVAISRFGVMFFEDPEAAFANIARAVRPGGGLAMMIWQARERNEWDLAIDTALRAGGVQPLPDPRWDPFSLGSARSIERLLGRAGFGDIALTDVDVPVFHGSDVDEALAWVTGFRTVDRALRESDPGATTRAFERLRATVAEHDTGHGIWFASRAWIVTGRRR